MEQMLLKRPTQFPVNELLNEEERIYRGWASVEIKDVHGEILSMSVFKKIMPVIMDRGGIILDSHSNRQTGKIINFEFKTNEETGQEGVLLTVKNFKGYQHDNLVWERIKNGDYTGFSFGGMSIGKPTIKFESGMDITKIINEFEGFEFSNVETPANSASTFTQINYLAKGDMTAEKETELIDENKKKPEAKDPHKFKAAQWTHPNGHPRCMICGDEERTDGMCEGIKKFEKCIKHVEKQTKIKTKSDEILEKINKLYNSKVYKNTDRFKYKNGFNKVMPEDIPTGNGNENGDVSSVEERLGKVEEAVGRILEMLQANVTEMKSKEEDKDKDEDEKEKKKQDDEDEEDKEKKKEENVSEKETLPKTPDEKIQEDPPASGEETDQSGAQIVEKELKEIKKTLAGQKVALKDLAEIKKMLEENKATTPKPGNDGIELKKAGVKRVKNFADAHRIARGK